MESFIIVLIVILGLVMGSFFACMGYRIPNKIKTTTPSSFCPKCGKALKWYMNIPVLSYVFLKGKCAYCKDPINPIYPFVEITTAVLFLCNYLMFDFNYEFFVATIITSALMVTLVSDFLYYYISDRVLVISGSALIIVSIVFLSYKELFMSIMYGVVLFLVMLGIKYLGNKIFKKESLGDGDIKLMGIIGIALGIIKSFIALFIASVIGLVFASIIAKKNKEGIIPFGPFLLIGALMVMYFSPWINAFVEKLISL